MKTDDLTVLVFKDNSTARTYRVPLNWISNLGIIAGTVGGLAVLGVFLTTKFYLAERQALKVANPAYVQDLEQEIASLRSTKALLQLQLQNGTQVAPQVQTSAVPVAAASAAAPAPTVTVTVTPVASAQTKTTQAAAPAFGFSALPAGVQAPPAPNDSAIAIYDPHVQWHGRTLTVQFFIQYVKEDKGNQQGRIILLARGGDTLLAYPSGVLNSSDSSSLVAPEKGEYFSVSRIREVKADFGPMKSNAALKDVEVFLFGNEGRLLVHQILTPTANAPAPAAPGTPPHEEDDT